MNFLLEDGTGIENATSYASVEYYKSYCDIFNYDYSNLTDDDIKVRLNKATAYIDTNYKFKGNKIKTNQGLNYPTEFASDGMFNAIKKAVVTIAVNIEEININEKNSNIASESYGKISRTYRAGANNKFKIVDKLLKDYITTDIDMVRVR